MTGREPIGEVLARVERYRRDGGRADGQAQQDAERLFDALRDVVAATGGTDPGELGGEIAGPGGPFDFGGVIIDATKAILADMVDVAKVDPDQGARGNDEMFALLVGGRVSQTDSRANVMLLGDLDFFASLITEMHGVTERAGPGYVRRLHQLCEERWAELPHPPAD